MKDRLKPLGTVIPKLCPNLDELIDNHNDADRIRVLLHNIYTVYQYPNIKSEWDIYLHNEGWVTLSAKKLESLFGSRYTVIVNLAESLGLIEINRNEKGNKCYAANSFSTLHRINPELLPVAGKKFRIEKIVSYKVIKAVLKTNAKWETANSFSGKYGFYEPLKNMLSHFYFDMEAMDLYIDELQKGKRLPSKKDNVSVEARINHIINASFGAELMNESYSINCSVCKYGNRFHSFYTRLPKELRNFIRIRGYSGALAMVDVKNSQPYFFALLINYPERLISLLPEFKTLINKFGNAYDRRQFLQLCIEGKIYDYWAYYSNISRNDAKSEIMKVLLFGKMDSRGKNHGNIRRRFKYMFGDVFSCIEYLKSADEKQFPFLQSIYMEIYGRYDKSESYKNLNLICQRLESRILLGFAQKIFEEKILTYPFLTVHDSFLVAEDDVDILIQSFKEYMAFLNLPAPTLDTKYY